MLARLRLGLTGTAIATLLVIAAPAVAEQNTTLLTSTIGNTTTGQPVVQLTINVPSAGAWYFNGYYLATTRYPNTVGLDGQYAQPLHSTWITCPGLNRDSVFSATNVPADGSQSTARVRDIMAFTAPGTYTCTLWGKTGSTRLSQLGLPTPYLNVQSGSLTAIPVPGATGFWNMASPTSESAITLNAGGSQNILSKNWTVPTTSSSLSTRADVSFDVQGSSGSSTVKIDLVVLQLNSSGAVCAGGTQMTATTTQTVTVGTHHRKMFTTLNGVPVAAGCSRQFAIRPKVTNVSGNPILVRGLAPDEPANHYSIGMVMNGNITV